MTLWHVLKTHRTIPSPPAWVRAVVFLGMGTYAGWLAFDLEPQKWNVGLNVGQIVEEQRGVSADCEALARALQESDQDLRQAALRQLESQQKAREERAAKRKADLAANFRKERAGLGAWAATSIAIGIWMLFGSASGGSGSRRPTPHAIGN